MYLVTEDNITDLAADRWATTHDDRTRTLLTSLVRHLHAFARENRLTEAEWMAAIQWLTATGQVSNEKREEFILTSDVLGLSMLVVQMNNQFEEGATPATVLARRPDARSFGDLRRERRICDDEWNVARSQHREAARCVKHARRVRSFEARELQDALVHDGRSAGSRQRLSAGDPHRGDEGEPPRAIPRSIGLRPSARAR